MEDQDFISELPEGLIHKIMSFLPYRDTVRTSILSSWLYSAWRSLPILEFDVDYYSQGIRMSSETFLQHVVDSIQNHSTMFLERLRIRADFNEEFSNLALETIFLATSRNLQELELENCDDMIDDDLDYRYFSVRLPINVLLLESLTVLKIEDFRFEFGPVVLETSSRLKKLSISRCIGFDALYIRNATSLEVLEIVCCEELTSVVIDAPNLESLEFLMPSWLNLPCEIMLAPGSNSLRNLKLKHLSLEESLFLLQETIPRSQMSLMEINSKNTLKLECIHMDWDYLKTLELEGIEVSRDMEISSQDLQSCVLDMRRSSTYKIRFKFSLFRFFKVLTISSSKTITGDWIQENLIQLCSLKQLTLRYCSNLEWIRFEHEGIESLKLIKCNALMDVNIAAPLLRNLEMKLKGIIPSQVVILSRPLHVKLSLNLSPVQLVPYEDLMNFLVSFDTCRELTLDFRSNYDLIFPSKVREKMTSPLYDLKHLKIELGLEQDDFSLLLSGLLWLVPFPDCITFIRSHSGIDQSIQFKYAGFEGEEEDRISCCFYFQCWRHSLRSIRLNNFQDRDKREIVNFFRSNALRLEAIQDDSELES